MKGSPVKILFFIIDWEKSKIISDVFEEKDICFSFISKGRGTASLQILNLLGIGSNDKAVILCLEQDFMIPILLKTIRQKLNSQSAVSGIAFTCNLSAINKPVLNILDERTNSNPTTKNIKEEKIMDEIKNDLIISIVNQGYSDELMTVAREAGARGGTILNTRGLTKNKMVKLFNISIQDEKEVILMLTSREARTPIMQAVSRAFGVNTQADGTIFSLPVDEVMSLNND